VSGGGETDDEQSGVGITKPWDRAAPVRLVAIGAAPDAADLLAICNQAWTEAALDDLLLKNSE
jgi:hypothetical protein